jgi:hypothetical protein
VCYFICARQESKGLLFNRAEGIAGKEQRTDRFGASVAAGMRDPIVPLLLFYCKKNAISWNILGGASARARSNAGIEKERERVIED